MKNRYMYTPVNPYFTIKTWGSRGLTFHGHVFYDVISFEECLEASIQ